MKLWTKTTGRASTYLQSANTCRARVLCAGATQQLHGVRFCIVTVIVIVCHWVWTLGVWGELACHKRLFNPPPQFSRLGTWCPTLLCATVLFVSVYVLGWRMGGGGWLLVFFLFYSLWLVCYKYTFHACFSPAEVGFYESCMSQCNST